MNTISRRSFLKMMGVTALTVAGASMLSGCSMTNEVSVTVLVNGTQMGTTTLKLPFFLHSIPKKQALKLVQEQAPEKYKDLKFAIDEKYENNCKIIKDKDGSCTLTIAVTADAKG